MISRCLFNDGSNRAEILGTVFGSETPRDLLFYFRHSQIPFCLVIRERHSKVFKKSKPAVFRALNRNARLCPMRRFRRPRFFRFDGGVRVGRFSWNVAACSATGIKSVLHILDCFRVASLWLEITVIRSFKQATAER